MKEGSEGKKEVTEGNKGSKGRYVKEGNEGSKGRGRRKEGRK